MTQIEETSSGHTNTQQEALFPLKGLFYLVGQHDAGILRTPDKEWKAACAGAFRRKYEAFAGRLKRMTDECLIFNPTIK